MEERIKDIMKKLDCTREEAIQILEDDDEIEHGADLFKLTPEQEKVSQQARSVDRKPAKQKAKRERKADEDKRTLIEMLKESILNHYLVIGSDCNLTVTNIERQIDWTDFDGRKFRIVLSCPRKQGAREHHAPAWAPQIFRKLKHLIQVLTNDSICSIV